MKSNSQLLINEVAPALAGATPSSPIEVQMSRLNIGCRILDPKFFETFGNVSYETKGSAGLDLRANLPNREPLTLQPGECQLIGTGIAIFINNPNYAGFIYPRSGLGHKRGLVLGNGVGVIDSDYQGELLVSLLNRSDKPQTIEYGERIAQLVIQRTTQVDFTFVDEFHSDSSERGAGGFGSTGKM